MLFAFASQLDGCQGRNYFLWQTLQTWSFWKCWQKVWNACCWSVAEAEKLSPFTPEHQSWPTFTQWTHHSFFSVTPSLFSMYNISRAANETFYSIPGNGICKMFPVGGMIESNTERPVRGMLTDTASCLKLLCLCLSSVVL